MDFQLASDAYTMAQRRGQKEYKEYVYNKTRRNPMILPIITQL